jgi:hypothetical protein
MRLDYPDVLPDALNAMLGLESVANSDLAIPRLLDLVKITASPLDALCRLCAASRRTRRYTSGGRDSDAIARRVLDVWTCPRAVSSTRSQVVFAEGAAKPAPGHQRRDCRPWGSTVVNAMSELSPLHA